MKKNIIVTSNCQTGGIAGALTQLFPEHKISPVHTTQARNPAFFNRNNPTVDKTKQVDGSRTSRAMPKKAHCHRLMRI